VPQIQTKELLGLTKIMYIVELVFVGTFLALWVGLLSYFLLTITFARKPSTIKKKPFFPTLTMVIATFNEAKVLPRKLDNTLGLDYPRDKFEILVVDSGSTDNTRSIVNDLMQKENKTRIRLLTQEERLGKSAALDYALKNCSSDIVVLSDADVMVSKDALLQATANFNDAAVGAVSGIEVIQNPDESSSTKLEQGYRNFYNTLRLGETNLDSVMMCESEFSAYRRELLGTIPCNSICDDMELTVQTRKKGFRAVYDPSILFFEYSPSTFSTRMKHKIRRGQGNQQTLLRCSNLLFKREYGKFSSVIMPFEFFMNIISPVLTAVCLASYLLIVFFYFNLFSVFLPLVLLVLTGFVVFASLKINSPATDITLKNAKSNSSFHMIVSIIDLISMELILLFSLLSLLLSGPKYKWEKIENTRRVS
jgi:biofilm PGA synthesis N-glycosyltransferase PgaC